ncbi:MULTISPECIES: aldose 1-epimerase family protein [Enterococcus]|uniref:aldose 1-epimerase family protein n=1 Tax=Enterococcus TaxID=1350 RepID=UPI0002A42E93|nr:MULTISPECIES: aldose 1-epimerase family protein [Enterococcus]ELB05477.1 hypothetical protein OIG_04358 [Enterococcus faecium EnGen0028]MDT6323812.1 aldose 1-epimerase family protein [Enterococcus faecium]HAQ4672475.1 aldose 1-epimerase family protein [Enterococcus faecium]HAQ4706624.1 aldose 1-epimerase family protein [Enterococcus faecium]HAR1638590.1 aldose 1-epimerase family protein [Enterococcus faecium]
MEKVILKNNEIQVEILLKGAELASVKDLIDETEYIWQADSEVWGRHAPVLFPIVGKLKNDSYSYKGKTYQMSQHGFARDMNFEIYNQSSQEVTFSLTATEETRACYPFDFQLLITYHLAGRELGIMYHVKNLDEEQDLYFSIGAHPGFNLPLDDQTTFDDYVLQLRPETTRKFIAVNNEVLLNPESSYEEQKNDFPIDRELFKNGVLIFKTTGPTSATLTSPYSSKQIKISYDDMPYLGIWSTYPIAGEFVCVEPWCGIADSKNTDGNYSKKIGINHLRPEEDFVRSYRIDFSDKVLD